jgi:hypothetical protein
MKPVAYAMFRDGQFYDAIHPDEYVKTAGEYDTPLYTYTQPKELTDEEILDIWQLKKSSGELHYDLLEFAKAILLKASGEG